MESLQTMTRGEVVSVRSVVTHIEYSPRVLNVAAHLGGPPHELSSQLEIRTVICKHTRLADEYPNGISNIPWMKILFCIRLALRLLPFERQGL